MTQKRPYPVKQVNTYLNAELVELLDEIADMHGTDRTTQFNKALILYNSEILLRTGTQEQKDRLKEVVTRHFNTR